MKQASHPAFVLGGLVVALLLCWAIISVAPDQEACNMFTEMLAEIEPTDVLAVYIGRLPKNQRERVYVGDLSGQHPLFVEVWGLRKEQIDLSDQVKVLQADREQKQSDREDQLEKLRGDVQHKQRELDLEAERIRLAYAGGYSPLTAREVRAELLRIEIQRQEMEIERIQQKQRIQEQNISELDALLTQISAIRGEMTPVYEQLIEKSRELLEQERGRECRWFGRWREPNWE